MAIRGESKVAIHVCRHNNMQIWRHKSDQSVLEAIGVALDFLVRFSPYYEHPHNTGDSVLKHRKMTIYGESFNRELIEIRLI